MARAWVSPWALANPDPVVGPEPGLSDVLAGRAGTVRTCQLPTFAGSRHTAPECYVCFIQPQPRMLHKKIVAEERNAILNNIEYAEKLRDIAFLRRVILIRSMRLRSFLNFELYKKGVVSCVRVDCQSKLRYTSFTHSFQK